MATDYNGFRALGEVLGGSGAPAQGSPAYMDGITSGYTAQKAGYSRDKAREDARIARIRALAREAIPEAMKTAGYQENMIPLLGSVLQSNNTIDMDQLGKYAVVEAGPAFTAASEAAAQGNTMDQNRQTALATGKPFEPFDLAAGGKTVFNPGTGDTEMTDLGEAAVLAQEALAGARRASAAATGAREDATRDRMDNPDKYRAPPKAKGKYSVGQVIEVNGKRYRVTGGDLNDPDVEEIP